MDDALLKFEHEWRFGNRRKAARIAADYIGQHEENLKKPPFNLHWYGTEGLVGMVEAYREKGDEGSRIIVDMWMLVKYPKSLADSYFPQDRMPELVLPSKVILNRFREEWKTGDRDKARMTAIDHASEMSHLNKALYSYDLEDIVLLCESYRHYGNEDSATFVEMFQLCEFDPQKITGEMNLGPVLYAA
jgi:hypothetical protein